MFYHKGHKGHEETLEGDITLSPCSSFVLFVSFVVKDVDKINRPSLMRWAIWFDFRFLSTGQASPNDTGIVIIIIVGGAERIFHDGGIIAQTRFREGKCLWRRVRLKVRE